MANASPDPGSAEPRGRGLRWWPALVIVVGAAVAICWIWFFRDVQRQDRFLQCVVAGLSACGLLLVWWLFFSRLRWKTRLVWAGGTVAAILLLVSLVKIRGVTGDLFPIFEWRWKPPGSQAISPAGSTGSAADVTPPVRRIGGDYPQFQGPNRDGTLSGPDLARDWQADPPEELWRQPIGPAWSGFAVAGSAAFTQEQRGDEELVTCYDLVSGQLIWSHADRAHYATTIAGEGPRATPTVTADCVYTEGATGVLNCLDRGTGKVVWSKNIVMENKARENDWGMAGSPLVLGDRVIVSAGGPDNRSLVAYDRNTGEFVWGGGSDHAGYSSPRLATLAGVKQILIFNAGEVAAHDPADGKVLWTYPWWRGHPHVANPLVLPPDRVLISTGYGRGSALLKIGQTNGQWTATRLWRSIRLKSKFANLIYHGGYIYGLDDGIMVCLDPANGAVKWKDGRYGHGQMILVADLLLILSEDGQLVLVEPVPEEHRELTRFTAFKEKTWNPPALAGRYLLVRNDKEAACFKMPVVTH